MRILLLVLISLPLGAANRYFVSGGVDNNWGTTGNWSLTDGGAGGQTVPSSIDSVFFTSNSPNCTVNTSARNSGILNFTGYTNTITMTNLITAAGDVTLGSGMGIAGSAALNIGSSATLTSNGKTWSAALNFTTTSTITLADNWQVSGLLTLGTSVITLNGFTLSHSGSLTIANGGITGTTNLVTNGTGTITSTQSTGAIRLNWTINTAGTITFASGLINYCTGTFTYTAGTIVGASGITLTATGIAGGTFAVSGITWGAITMTGSFTYTLSQDLVTSGLATLGGTTSATVFNGSKIKAGGGLRYNGTSGVISGTTVMYLTGTGTVDAPNWTSGRIANPITIDSGVGTVTVSTPFQIDFGKLTFVSGTVVTNNTWSTPGATSGPQASTFQ